MSPCRNHQGIKNEQLCNEQLRLCLGPFAGFREQCGDRLRADVRQFLRFHLVEAAAIDAALAEQGFRLDRVQELPHLPFELGIAFERMRERRLGVEHEIDVRCRCPRMVQDEAKRPPAFHVAPAHVGADEGRGRAVLLRVPGRPEAAEIALGHRRLAGLQIGPEGRVTLFDLTFGQAAIQYE